MVITASCWVMTKITFLEIKFEDSQHSLGRHCWNKGWRTWPGEGPAMGSHLRSRAGGMGEDTKEPWWRAGVHTASPAIPSWCNPL